MAPQSSPPRPFTGESQLKEGTQQFDKKQCVNSVLFQASFIENNNKIMFIAHFKHMTAYGIMERQMNGRK